MRGAWGWVFGGMLSLAAWTVVACGDGDQVDLGADITRDASPPDKAPAPDAGVDSALPDRAAPDTAPADSGSDALDTDGFSVTVSPTAGTIGENI